MIDIATSVATPLAKGTLALVTSGKGATFESALNALTLTAAAFEPDVLYAGPDGKAAPTGLVPTTPPPSDTTRYADVVLLDLSGKRQRIAGGGKEMPPKSPPIAEPGEAAKDAIRLPVGKVPPVPAPIDITRYADVVLLDLSGKRQHIAGGGKETLPERPTIAEPDEDASKDVIWSPIGMALPLPLPTPVAPIVQVVNGASTAPILPSPDTPVYAATPASPAAAAADQPRSTATVMTKDGVVAPIVAREAAKLDLPIRIDVTPMPATAPLQSAPAPVTQFAGQVFAAAIAAVVQSRRDEREPGDPRAPLGLAAAALEAVHKPAVAATADAKQGALDLRQDSGLQGMIDRIETLRDDADARDTRIRLVPDALGAIDVSVRKDGERVHVHFAAENQASARLLSDAQPRLADLAEARGLKLGQTTVGSGAGSGTDSTAGNARQQQASPILPHAPAAILAADAAAITDTRIA